MVPVASGFTSQRNPQGLNGTPRDSRISFPGAALLPRGVTDQLTPLVQSHRSTCSAGKRGQRGGALIKADRQHRAEPTESCVRPGDIGGTALNAVRNAPPLTRAHQGGGGGFPEIRRRLEKSSHAGQERGVCLTTSFLCFFLPSSSSCKFA